jgi:hypothetical protein
MVDAMRLVLTSITLIAVFGLSIQMGHTQKSIGALRVVEEISIDGSLSEIGWSQAESANGFINYSPLPGTEPTQDTDVKILYDDDAIYIGAFLWDDDPASILREYSLRDDGRSNASEFSVIIDTYQGQQNASVFSVTAAGVQYDSQKTGGNDNEDKNWDAVWESALSIDDKGWFVEMRIPYSALRFVEKPEQIWNINFIREIRRTREQNSWNPINPEIGSHLIQMGRLTGLIELKPPFRLSFTPYLAFLANHKKDNSGMVDPSWNSEFGGGLDLKYGINEAYTLDMTLIPDFSEVQSDDAVLNLGPFEVAFDENRPFFTEGTELFNQTNLFYSRRVGGVPKFYGNASASLLDGEVIEDNPNVAQLINATKLSGRNGNGLGIGLFNAVESESHATIRREDGSKRKVQTGPLTNYNMLVFDQLMANGGNVYAMNSNVYRNGSYYDANVTAGGFRLRNKDQSYEIKGFGSLSQRYETGEADFGHAYQAAVAKTSGNLTAEIGINVESHDYDVNDLGLLLSANERTAGLDVSYNDYDGFWGLAKAGVTMSTLYSRLYKPDAFYDFAINLDAHFVFPSFNAFGFSGRYEPVNTYDYFDPRTIDFSRYLLYPKNERFGAWFSSDYRKVLAFDFRVNGRNFSPDGRYTWDWNFEPRIRFNDHFFVVGSIKQIKQMDDRGFVTNYNDQIIMGDRDRNTIINSVNARYIFNENIGLALRVRHYWSVVKYDGFYELNEESALIETSYDGRDGGDIIHNLSQSFFNVDCVLKWRFAPGSDLILTWKNSVNPIDGLVDESYWDETASLFDGAVRNSFSLKILYYHDWARLKALWK